MNIQIDEAAVFKSQKQRRRVMMLLRQGMSNYPKGAYPASSYFKYTKKHGLNFLGYEVGGRGGLVVNSENLSKHVVPGQEKRFLGMLSKVRTILQPYERKDAPVALSQKVVIPSKGTLSKVLPGMQSLRKSSKKSPLASPHAVETFGSFVHAVKRSNELRRAGFQVTRKGKNLHIRGNISNLPVVKRNNL